MTIAFTAIEIRSVRRLRLAFSESLAVGAFTVLSTYSVTCNDGKGADPSVVAAFVLPANPAIVEIALDTDLVGGARYTVGAIGVPASAGGVTPAGSTLPCCPGERQQAPATASPEDDIFAELFGVDLVHDGADLVEDASGDLATVSGIENAKAALERAALCDGLLWDAAWGAHPRKYVDGSSLLASELAGDLTSQALRDDRVERASAKVLPGDETHPEETFVELTAQLVGGAVVSTQIPVKTQ